MHCHCGTNNRAPRWTFTFTDPCNPEVRPGAREESASPAWLAAPAMNARDTTKLYIWRLDTWCGPTLYRKWHSHNTPGKGIISIESNPSRGTVLAAQHGKWNKCDKNVSILKYRKKNLLVFFHMHSRVWWWNILYHVLKIQKSYKFQNKKRYIHLHSTYILSLRNKQ